MEDIIAFTLRGKELNSAQVDQLATVILALPVEDYEQNEKCNLTPIVAGQLKSLYDGSVTKCQVKQEGPQYCIQYTPTMRGRHSLTVSVDGQQVAGSPFPVSVSIHPKQLGKPVKVWTGLNNPSCISVNLKGKLIIAEREGDVVILDNDGSRQTIVKTSKYGFKRISGLEVDDEDSIYLICDESTVVRSNKDGTYIQFCTVKLSTNRYLEAVKVVGDEVMIFEDGNKCGVSWMVYNKDLKFKARSHMLKECLSFMNVDKHGNVYFSHFGFVKVFNKHAIFLYSFGFDNNGVLMVDNPCDICVSGQFLYVTNSGKGQVSVFTTTGDYVTSFGQYGEEENELISPNAIFTDLDNFIYVSDSDNARVLCF